MLPILVDIFIKEHKDYVLTFQTPVMKTFLGIYQTTITMQKNKIGLKQNKKNIFK